MVALSSEHGKIKYMGAETSELIAIKFCIGWTHHALYKRHRQCQNVKVKGLQVT